MSSHPNVAAVVQGFRCMALLAGLAAVACGCSPLSYYTQAVNGHFQVVSRQVPTTRLLADTNTSPELRAQLHLASNLCAFAELELGLLANGAYARYADLERPYVVWNVYAAPEYSLEAKTWWYPFVGSFDYRGYFHEQGARRYADKLQRRGYDVYVEGASAYSTLGWFNDPLLNTFLHYEEPVLAEVLFHELAHQRVFLPGDTEFNEAFATTVAHEGVRRWLRKQEDPMRLADYESALDREEQVVQIVQDARRRLKLSYTLGDPESPQAAKEVVFQALREDFQSLTTNDDAFQDYSGWFAQHLNNAKLNSVATYHTLVPRFDKLLGECGGDLETFYAVVKHMRKLKKAERRQRLGIADTAVASTPTAETRGWSSAREQ